MRPAPGAEPPSTDREPTAADGSEPGGTIGRPLAGGPRLLLVEDEADLAGMLRGLFVDEGYAVDVAANGQTGLHYGLTRSYDVVVLDRRLPVVEGLELVRTWRRRGVTTPILVLSAQGSPAERVEGLDAGAEDYLAKPFDIDELLARLRALQRRHLDRARVLPVPDGCLDLDTREVSGAGHAPVALSERECALLATLAQRPQQVFSRADLLASVFPEAEKPVAVDTYVHYLRRKLGRHIIETVRGRGYRLGRR
jgi:two-component system, OmpR family, response regulator QseB